MKDITGQKFNRLTAIKFSHVEKPAYRYFWVFKCDCGKETVARIEGVKFGDTKSCGCYQREKASQSMKKTMTTHGMTDTKFYWTWRRILQRCNDPNIERYSRYGGRGIKCLWKSFEEFRDDMHEPYLTHVKEFGEKQTTIDRINNDGNYCKENCRWSTLKEQQHNTSRSHLITFNGKTQCLTKWAEEIGIPASALGLRIVRRNWSVKKSLTTPLLRQSNF